MHARVRPSGPSECHFSLQRARQACPGTMSQHAGWNKNDILMVLRGTKSRLQGCMKVLFYGPTQHVTFQRSLHLRRNVIFITISLAYYISIRRFTRWLVITGTVLFLLRARSCLKVCKWLCCSLLKCKLCSWLMVLCLRDGLGRNKLRGRVLRLRRIKQRQEAASSGSLLSHAGILGKGGLFVSPTLEDRLNGLTGSLLKLEPVVLYRFTAYR